MAFEAIGLTATAEQALAMIRPGRTAYLVEVPPATSTFALSGTALVMQAKGIQGLSWATVHQPSRCHASSTTT